MDVPLLTSWRVNYLTSLRPSSQQSLWICAYCSLSKVKEKKMCKDLSARVAGAKKGRGGWKAQNPNPPFSSPFDTCHAGWVYLDKRTQNTFRQDSGWFPSRAGMGKKKKHRKYEACLGKSYSIISFLDWYPVMVNQMVSKKKKKKKNNAPGAKIKSSNCMTLFYFVWSLLKREEKSLRHVAMVALKKWIRTVSRLKSLRIVLLNVNLKIVKSKLFKRVLTDVSAVLPSTGYKTDKRHRSHLVPFNLSNVGEISWGWIERSVSEIRN